MRHWFVILGLSSTKVMNFILAGELGSEVVMLIMFSFETNYKVHTITVSGCN